MNDAGEKRSDYIRVSAAARRLAVSPDFIRGRIEAGEIPAYKLGPSRNAPLVVQWSDVEEWMATRQVCADGARPARHQRRRVVGRSALANAWGV